MKITLYSTGCPKCAVITKKLQNKRFTFNICEDVEVMRSKGFTELPMLEVDGKIMTFAEANNWINSTEGDKN